MTEEEALKALKRRIDELVRQERFSGSVLIARQGKAVFSDVRGMQDREKKVPNRLDTKYNLGSMNKMFTAVAVAQLARHGKLKFTDPVGKHIPDYPNPDVAKKVTIHHLLTHTGGTGDIFGPKFSAKLEKIKTPKDYIALYGKRAPAFEPGSRSAYSNYGMVLAGAIIERVSGMSYYDYIRKNDARVARRRRLLNVRGPSALRHRADRPQTTRRRAHEDPDYRQVGRWARQQLRIWIRRLESEWCPKLRPRRGRARNQR
jgi:CubicO group peptidase (beta-lactamase class C family)